MKQTNIIYWTSTGLFGAFMFFSGITNILVVPDAVTLFQQLGFPAYLIPFLGWAKTLGVIALFVPGFPRVREWAYAGLFFDLLGATYAMYCSGGLQPPMLFMVLPFTLLFVSHAYNHKRMNAIVKSGASVMA